VGEALGERLHDAGLPADVEPGLPELGDCFRFNVAEVDAAGRGGARARIRKCPLVLLDGPAEEVQLLCHLGSHVQTNASEAEKSRVYFA